MATKQQGQIVETPTEARQAEPGPSVLALLTVSTGLAIMVLAGVWYVFFRTWLWNSGHSDALAQGAERIKRQGLLCRGLGTDRVSRRVDSPAGFAFSRLNWLADTAHKNPARAVRVGVV
jgi:hypothetical protein